MMSTSGAVTRALTPNQQERRHRILSAARQLVASHGYEGMIMRDVATLANVSPTTLYNLYNTKNELLLEALREAVADGWSRASAEAPELGFDRLVVQLRHSVSQTREEPAYAKAITQALLHANHGDPLMDVLFDGTTRAVRASLAVMQTNQELTHTVDTGTLARTLVAAFWAGYMQWSKGVLGLDELERELRRSYLSYLLPVTQGARQKQIQRELQSMQGGGRERQRGRE